MQQELILQQERQVSRGKKNKCVANRSRIRKKKCCVRDAVTEIKSAMEEDTFATWNSDGRGRLLLRRSNKILECRIEGFCESTMMRLKKKWPEKTLTHGTTLAVYGIETLRGHAEVLQRVWSVGFENPTALIPCGERERSDRREREKRVLYL